MSGALALVGTAATFGIPAVMAAGDLVPAWIRQGRKIGNIIPDVVIEEQHADRMTVTQHPVAIGQPINDHAFRMAGTLTMRCGWSNANVVGAAVQGGIAGAWSAFTETRAREVYTALRKLQGTVRGDPPMLVDITTGKRDYRNMALVEITVSTDHTKEYALFVEAHFQEVLPAKTRSTTQPATNEMARPETTEATVTGSQVQPQERSSLSLETGSQVQGHVAGTAPLDDPNLGPGPTPQRHPLRARYAGV